MPQLSPPRIRMPRVTLPGRGRATAATRARRPTGKAKPEAKTAETAAAAKPSAAKAPEPNLQERMEGLQGWMAEIERRQGRMTYFLGAAVVIALAAAGASLYFALNTKNDSATKGDLGALSKRVDTLQSAVTKNSKDTQNTLNASTAQLQQSIATLQKQQAQNAATISTLQSQVASGAAGKGAAGAGAGVTITPGTTTTKPKKP
jgi:uncharacterized protein HemX